MLHTVAKDLAGAVELFRTYEGLSAGDAAIALHVSREGFEYLYSSDGEFDAVEDITRLAARGEPFVRSPEPWSPGGASPLRTRSGEARRARGGVRTYLSSRLRA